MNTLDVVDRFDPNDDMERLLRDTETMLRPLRAPRSTPLAKADLESLAQHIAKKLGQGVQ